MNDLDLRAAARTINLPPGDVDAVTARGRRLAQRRHRVVAGGLAVVLVAVSAGIYARANQPRPVPVRVGDDAVKRGDVAIRWEKVDSRSGLAFTQALSEEALYAVSTGPGTSQASAQRRVVWHSQDGVDWDEVADLKSDLYVGKLADRGTRLYGVGTGAATASVAGHKPFADLVVGASDDGGHTWARQTLPVDMRAIAAKSTDVGVYAVDIATTDNAVVALASLNANLDVPSVLPAGAPAPQHGWVITESGVDVLGDGPECPAGTTSTPPGQEDKRAAMARSGNDDDNGRKYRTACYSSDGTARTVTPQETRGVTASYTWSQLGVAGDLLRAVKTEPMVFRAERGSMAFQRVESPEVATLDGPGQLDRDGDGLLIVGQKNGFPEPQGMRESVLLRSSDGRTWSTAPMPGGLSWAAAVGRLGQQTAIVGEAESGPMLWVGDGNGGWSSTALADAVDPELRDKSNVSVVGAAIGPLGVVTVMSVYPDAIAKSGGITTTKDGYTLHITNDRWAGYVTDPSGKEVARADNVLRSEGGAIRGTPDGGAQLVDLATGAVIVTFGEGLRSGMDKAFRDVRVTNPEFRIVASRDGVTWSDQDTSALSEGPVGSIGFVLMRGERAVVAVSRPPTPGSRESAKQVALVGTPR
jgi:hypothetical protein